MRNIWSPWHKPAASGVAVLSMAAPVWSVRRLATGSVRLQTVRSANRLNRFTGCNYSGEASPPLRVASHSHQPEHRPNKHTVTAEGDHLAAFSELVFVFLLILRSPVSLSWEDAERWADRQWEVRTEPARWPTELRDRAIISSQTTRPIVFKVGMHLPSHPLANGLKDESSVRKGFFITAGKVLLFCTLHNPQDISAHQWFSWYFITYNTPRSFSKPDA